MAEEKALKDKLLEALEASGRPFIVAVGFRKYESQLDFPNRAKFEIILMCRQGFIEARKQDVVGAIKLVMPLGCSYLIRTFINSEEVLPHIFINTLK